jgi:hypothetical protein
MPSFFEVIDSLKETAPKTNFKGYDPYDGLYLDNFLGKILKTNKFGRLFLIHLNKRSVLNLRPFLGIRTALNPKAAALFLSGSVKLERLEDAVYLKESLLGIRIPGYEGDAWGYYFPWQSRVFFLPENTPNAVVTSFVAHAFMDLFEKTGEDLLLETVQNSIVFILKELNQFRDGNGLCFSYSPLDQSVIYNASALCLEVIARYCNLSGTKDGEWDDILASGVNFIKAEQNEDGSWFYGKQLVQHFIDHYHTAYLLDSLEKIRIYTGDQYHLKPVIEKGLNFYLRNLFTESYVPKFYKNAVYPIESHCSGAAIKALCTLSSTYGKELYEVAVKVAEFAVKNLYDNNKGHFFYQKRKFWTNKVDYLRWSQAWMFIGLAYLIHYGKKYEYSLD